jgi:hypothetical protein
MHFDDYFGAMLLRDVMEFAAASGGFDPDAKLTRLLDGLAAGPIEAGADQPRPMGAHTDERRVTSVHRDSAPPRRAIEHDAGRWRTAGAPNRRVGRRA